MDFQIGQIIHTFSHYVKHDYANDPVPILTTQIYDGSRFVDYHGPEGLALRERLAEAHKLNGEKA